MLAEAIEAKRQEYKSQGKKLGLREIADASNTTESYLSRMMRGKHHPTPEMISSLSRALDPYFPLDEALVEAGYMPADPTTRNALHRLVRLPADLRRRALERLGEFTLTDAPSGQGGEKDARGDDKPDAPAGQGRDEQ